MNDRFVYKSFQIKPREISFEFEYRGDKEQFTFHHRFALLESASIDTTDSNIQNLVFNLGMAVLPYYYSLHCATEIVVEAAALDDESIQFFSETYQYGLAELKYTSNLDVTQPISIRSTSQHQLPKPSPKQFAETYIISHGGGKDSIVTGEVLNTLQKDSQWFVLGYDGRRIEHILPSIQVSPFPKVTLFDQTPDPYVFADQFATKHQVYLGHKPLNMLLSFLGVFAAYLNGKKYFVISNEGSANEGNVRVGNVEVNHQYSKSLAYEQLFQKFLSTSLPVGVEYFSLIRPFPADQTSRYFCAFRQYFPVFMSCNSGIETGVWCGHCPKCAYIFLVLTRYIGHQEAVRIFGKDLFADLALETTFLELAGVQGVKPFDCVGEMLEVQQLFFDLKGIVASPLIEKITMEKHQPHQKLLPQSDYTYSSELYLAVEQAILDKTSR